MLQKIWIWAGDLSTSYSLCKLLFKVIMKIRKSDITAGLSYAGMIIEARELTLTFGINRSEELRARHQSD